jgi:hypothetical protein
MSIVDYQSLPETTRCFLDGRYFNKAFASYPGLIREPLHVTVADTGKKWKVSVFMRPTQIDTRHINILRVIIHTPTSRHSNVILIDYKNKMVQIFDPVQTTDCEQDRETDVKTQKELDKMMKKRKKMSEKIRKRIKEYLNMYYPGLSVTYTRVEVPSACQAGCDYSGFCVAYCIMYVYYTMNNLVPYFYDVKRFARFIEMKYGELPAEGEDREYGLFDNNGQYSQGQSALGGAVLGGLIGGVAAGPTGLIVGAGLGGLTGAATNNAGLGGLTGGVGALFVGK